MDRRRFEGNPVEVVSGTAASASLWDLVAELTAAAADGPPLVVCGRSVGGQGWFRELVAKAPAGTAVFDEVEPDPTDETVRRAGEAARAEGCGAIVGIGGGSSMDASKAVAVEAAAPGWIASQDRPGQPAEVEVGPLPAVAVPTTAGTGAEVTGAAVITFAASHHKLALRHAKLYARLAVLDPTLLATAPRAARVAAGLDALTHAVESYVSRAGDDLSRGWAYEAVEALVASLPAACAEPPEGAALARAQWAATLAGVALARSKLGIVHALALPLSALFGVPHGVANAILLPYGMRFNAAAAPEVYAALAPALGAEGGDVAELAAEAAAQVRKFGLVLGSPRTLAEVGVDLAAVPEMAAQAAKSAHMAINPRPASEADLAGLYEQAYEGTW